MEQLFYSGRQTASPLEVIGRVSERVKIYWRKEKLQASAPIIIALEEEIDE